MYPLVQTRATGVEVVVECVQYDVGNVKYFTVDHDLSGESARFIIDLKDGTKVGDWCDIIDNHTLRFAIPINCTREAGTYDASIEFYGKNYINDSFEKWKASVLAGKERVLVIPPVNNTSDVTTPPDSALSSFAFRIMVYPSVRHNGDIYQNTLESLGDAVKNLTDLREEQEKKVEDMLREAQQETQSMREEYTQIVQQIESLDLTQVIGRLNTLDAWRTSVEAGSTEVLIKTNEAPPEEPSGEDTGTKTPAEGDENA